MFENKTAFSGEKLEKCPRVYACFPFFGTEVLTISPHIFKLTQTHCVKAIDQLKTKYLFSDL